MGSLKITAKLLLLIFIPLLFLVLTVLTADAQGGRRRIRMPKTIFFVGTEKCTGGGECHDPWLGAWRNSAHGKTYNLLKPGERAKAKQRAEASIKEKLLKYGGRDKVYVDSLDVVNADFTNEPFCLMCHTTGFGQVGGFNPGETEIDPDEPNFEQVGCEMCHSVMGGSQYRVLMNNTEGDFTSAQAEKHGKRYDNNTGNVCKRCHEHPNTPFQPSLDPKYKFNFEERRKKVHNIKKYINKYNKGHLLDKRKDRLTKDPGITYKKSLEIEDWVIMDGKVRFKALPLYKGILRFNDGSRLPLKDLEAELP